jgi:protein transport protein HofQ
MKLITNLLTVSSSRRIKESAGSAGRIIVAIVLLYLASPTNASSPTETPTISLRFEDAPISVVLQALADQQNINLVISESVSGNLTVKLEHVQWRQALEVILHLAQLEAEIKNGVMLIMPRQERQRRDQATQAEDTRIKQLQPLSQLSVNIQHTDADTLVNVLNQQKGGILSERAFVGVEKRTNTLFIHDYPENLAAIKTFIEALDQPQRQVQITAHIVTIGSNGLKELGVQWGLDKSDAIGLSNVGIHLAASAPSVNTGFNLAKLNGRLLSLELSAMEQENEVEIIAAPRLLTANNQPAAIKQGTELPYEVSNGSNGTTSIEFKSAVLGLEVTPKILPNDKVSLALYIAQNTPGRTIKQSNGGEVLAIDTQEIRTQVIVSNNETLVLGGVFQQSSIVGKSKVPLISSIPLLGRLFSHSSQRNDKRELIIFITPTLIDT